jgi:hypothetical protein
MKASLCCYCEYWELATEDGETGWCKIKNHWTNWKSTCDTYAEGK